MVVSRPSLFSDRTVTGAITSSQSVPISTNGASVVSWGVTGTWTGNLDFEATVDGVNWFPISATPVLPSFGVESATTANGQWSASVGGFNSLRIRGNAVTSGAANVYLNASAAGTSIQSVSVVSTNDTLLTGYTLEYNEISSVASNVESTIITVSAISEPKRIQRIEVSGDNVALFKLKLDASVVGVKRTWWTNFNQTFEFDFNGIIINTEHSATVTVTHQRPNLGSFNATVILK